jgi:hypothetical protein
MIVGTSLFATFAGAGANIFMRQVQKTTNMDSIEDRVIRMEQRQREFHNALLIQLSKIEAKD